MTTAVRNNTDLELDRRQVLVWPGAADTSVTFQAGAAIMCNGRRLRFAETTTLTMPEMQQRLLDAGLPLRCVPSDDPQYCMEKQQWAAQRRDAADQAAPGRKETRRHYALLRTKLSGGRLRPPDVLELMDLIDAHEHALLNPNEDDPR